MSLVKWAPVWKPVAEINAMNLTHLYGVYDRSRAIRIISLPHILVSFIDNVYIMDMSLYQHQ